MKYFVGSLLLVLASCHLCGQTFTETRTLTCGDTAYIGGLGYPTWNAPTITQHARVGNSVLIGDFVAANELAYTAPPYFTGLDTVIIACAKATQITCDTGIYVFNIVCDTASPAVFVYDVPCHGTIKSSTLSAWSLPYVSLAPRHGVASVTFLPTDGAELEYTHTEGLMGTDWVALRHSVTQEIIALYVFKLQCTLADIDVHSAQHAFVYPNPSQTAPYLVFPKATEAFAVYTAQGKRVYGSNLQQSDKTRGEVQLRHLPKAIYYIQLIGEYGIFTLPYIQAE